MSAKEVKDLIDQVKVAKDALDIAEAAFDAAKNNRRAAMDALSTVQNGLAVALESSNFIGGDYSLIKRQGAEV